MKCRKFFNGLLKKQVYFEKLIKRDLKSKFKVFFNSKCVFQMKDFEITLFS
jgi:hypothetical protein